MSGLAKTAASRVPPAGWWVALALLAAHPAAAYSVLAHEAIIDAAWDDGLKPILLARFPDLTPEGLRQAHGYAYGGAIIQDMGYYPFGSKLFSDLLHYAASGDFVAALIHDAQDPNELAFALGALAHYTADGIGHPVAVNQSVPMLYPKLRRKFGDLVTYEDNPRAHIQVEFGLDVLEVARGSYASQAYHDFIGFQVSKPVLERAFQDTYGMPLASIFTDFDHALGTYRHSVSSLIPKMTRVAWAEKKDQIGATVPGATRRRFVYNLSRSGYEKEWGRTYQKPGIGDRIMAIIIRLIPKVGPFRALGFRLPTPAAERLLMDSFNRTLTSYRESLAEVRKGGIKLPGRNLDTGREVRRGEYWMADQTYAKLLDKLADAQAVPPTSLKRELIEFYAQPGPALTDKEQKELETVRQPAQSPAQPLFSR